MRVLLCLVLLILPLTLSGCVVSIGNKGKSVKPVDERVGDLEQRMLVIEEQLGIPTPPDLEESTEPAN